MKYKYSFDELIYDDEDRDLIISVDEQIQLIAQFLMSDVQMDPESYIEALDSILNGTSDYEELNGNVCGILINKNKTKVIDCLADDGMGEWCEIETEELRELIDIWINKLEEFEKQRLHS